jgi:hypothetical protein
MTPSGEHLLAVRPALLTPGKTEPASKTCFVLGRSITVGPWFGDRIKGRLLRCIGRLLAHSGADLVRRDVRSWGNLTPTARGPTAIEGSEQKRGLYPSGASRVDDQRLDWSRGVQPLELVRVGRSSTAHAAAPNGGNGGPSGQARAFRGTCRTRWSVCPFPNALSHLEEVR